MKKFRLIMVLIMAVLGISITSYAGTSDEEAAKAETLINYYRLANGHAAIAVDETLTDAAKTRAAETAIYNSHYRPDGTPWYTVDDDIYGECLADGFTKAEDVVNAWMNSESHQKELMNDYSIMNVQTYVSNDGTWYWALEMG